MESPADESVVIGPVQNTMHLLVLGDATSLAWQAPSDHQPRDVEPSAPLA